MKDLNQNQLILLVLLITFVTSIATGIMTVSLLQQAPVEVTQTINRVVERTIEQVAPTGGIISTLTSSTKKDVTTVVVKEEDLIMSSINKNIKSIARITETDVNGNKTFYGLGVIVSRDGVIAASDKGSNESSIYSATLSDGQEFKILSFVGQNQKKATTTFFKVNMPPKTTYAFSTAQFSTSDLQLGQTIIGLGGESQNAVATGRVTTFSFAKDTSVSASTTPKYIIGVDTDISSGDITSGSSFFNLSGDLVGIKLSASSGKSFTPIALVYKELVSLTQK